MEERTFKLGFLDGVRDEAEALGYCYQAAKSTAYCNGYAEGRRAYAESLSRFRQGLAPTVPAAAAASSIRNDDGSPAGVLR